MNFESSGEMPGNMANLSYEQLKELYKLQTTKEKALLRLELVQALAPVICDKKEATDYNAKRLIRQVNDIMYYLDSGLI